MRYAESDGTKVVATVPAETPLVARAHGPLSPIQTRLKDLLEARSTLHAVHGAW